LWRHTFPEGVGGVCVCMCEFDHVCMGVCVYISVCRFFSTHRGEGGGQFVETCLPWMLAVFVCVCGRVCMLVYVYACLCVWVCVCNVRVCKLVVGLGED